MCFPKIHPQKSGIDKNFEVSTKIKINLYEFEQCLAAQSEFLMTVL